MVGGPWAGVLVGVSAFLLLSMGGAVVAAPLTVPLLYLIARADAARPGLRAAAVAVAALTVAEVAWAATYMAVAESRPWIWLLPVAAGVATANSCRSRVTGDRQRRPRLGNDIVRP
jgi:hypothetical protein